MAAIAAGFATGDCTPMAECTRVEIALIYVVGQTVAR